MPKDAKWFKHKARSIDDPDILALIKKFGHTGYYAFFGILEIMTQEFDVNKPGTFLFDHDFLRKRLGLSWKKIEKILKECHKRRRIMAEFNGDEVHLNCPKLKELMDNYTQRKLADTQYKGKPKDGQLTAKPTPIVPPDREGDKDIDKEEVPFSPQGPEWSIAKDLAYSIIEKCPAEKLQWAMDEMTALLNMGIKVDEIQTAIKANPGKKAREIANTIKQALTPKQGKDHVMSYGKIITCKLCGQSKNERDKVCKACKNDPVLAEEVKGYKK